jgi:hypothetical protein
MLATSFNMAAPPLLDTPATPNLHTHCSLLASSALQQLCHAGLQGTMALVGLDRGSCCRGALAPQYFDAELDAAGNRWWLHDRTTKDTHPHTHVLTPLLHQWLSSSGRECLSWDLRLCGRGFFATPVL